MRFSKWLRKFYAPEHILPKTHFLIRELLESASAYADSPKAVTHIEPES